MKITVKTTTNTQLKYAEITDSRAKKTHQTKMAVCRNDELK